MSLDRVVSFVAGGNPPAAYRGAAGVRKAIKVCEQRAQDAAYLVGWPALAASWSRDAERLKAQLLKEPK